MHTEKNIHLSVIVPTYNSNDALTKNLPVLLNHLKSKEYSFEVIIVDDGSDESKKAKPIAERFGCTYVGYKENKGKGEALRVGMLAARGEYRIFTDADIPYELDALDTMLRYLDFKEFDMCTGDRTLKESKYFDRVSKIRSMGSKLFSAFVGRFVAGGLYDTQCGIKGFRADVAEDIFSVSRINGFAIDVELYYIALKRNYDIKRIPVVLRSADGSSVNVLKHGIQAFFDVSRMVIHYYMGKYTKKDNHEHDHDHGHSHAHDHRRTGDTIEIEGNYQYNALHTASAPQRFWHFAKLSEAKKALELRDNDKILDAGCGSGTFAEMFKDEKRHIFLTGVDANERAIAFAQKTYGSDRITYKKGLIDELGFEDNAFDKVVFLEVIEHITKKQAEEVLEEFHRIMKSGGRLTISTPNGKSMWPFIEWLMDRLKVAPEMDGHQHEFFYDFDTLQEIVESAGFTCVKKQTINTIAPWLAVLSWKLALRINTWEQKLFKKRGNILVYTFEKK